MSTNESPTKTRTRSPAYPVIGLGKAVELAGKLWTSIRKSESHIDSALAAMGFARHGESLRIIAALGHYGLIDENGSGDGRRVRLSERAQDIIHLADDDVRKLDALKEAALAPAIHAALWERYGRTLPSEAAIRPFLIRDKGFSDSVVEDVIENYVESFKLAGLDKLAEDNAHDEKVVKTVPATSSPPQSQASSTFKMTDPLAAIHSQELPILVGENRHARIPFPMTEDDFDLLIGTLNLWKKKIVMVPPSREVAGDFFTYHGQKLPETFPRDAVWKNKDHDAPVTIVGTMGEHDGETYYQSSTGTGIPASELEFQ